MALTLWFTGLPSIGKSTLAKEVARQLEILKKPVTLLESDRFAPYFDCIPDKDTLYREVLLQAMAMTALHLNRQNIIALCTAVSPSRTFRRRLRRQIPGFKEVYCMGDVQTAQQRDYRGLYGLARQGFIDNFIGVDAPYDVPEHAELTVDTRCVSPEQGAAMVMAFLEQLEP